MQKTIFALVIVATCGLTACGGAAYRTGPSGSSSVRGSVVEIPTIAKQYNFEGPPEAMQQIALREKIRKLLAETYEDERQGINPRLRIAEIKKLAAQLKE